MENKKSYSDLTKAYAMTQIQMEQFLDKIYADMVLNELILKKEKEKILEQIDHALDLRDKEQFFQLTNELQQLEMKFGQ
ncbi:IDEAL domain-containing protein [Heyndrickxia ginsengihumi]|uniref:IDEAL domain-containing protein n=1 Tax=Heyndrickxia ginsengihumi TaxID=363870 RepID=A0A0A6VEK5_9BACI|nr:IDEAL domain-containing protein [Heyndrickxia ginsengihumi]KHD85898.1 hypothetical protein NG54_06520 [Heyndrickxia ginsengihumi]MBE6185190.1 IDEAL domain-containing protein [Bacillus sp. (in: firmicutes)]MCM3023597.1 IDEAL domain-containing protein [Heyndrickxia ginsengihumi]NEY18862.1 IDEAL domain-containing protein [Heyndrickxia ginsengihumi]